MTCLGESVDSGEDAGVTFRNGQSQSQGQCATRVDREQEEVFEDQLGATPGWHDNLEPCPQVNTSGRTDGGTNKELGGPLPGMGT